MKCNVVKDLLPLYIDGMTSKESAAEVEKHLKTCSSCKKYYREMAGDLSDVLPVAEADEAKLIKREQIRQRRIKIFAVSAVAFACFVLAVAVLLFRPSTVKYSDVNLTWEREGNHISVALSPKGHESISFNGYTEEIKDDSGKTIGIRSHLKLASKNKSLGGKRDNSSIWGADIDDKNQVYEWVFEFADKTITIRNGELIVNE